MQSATVAKGRFVSLEHSLRCARGGDNKALGQLLGGGEPLLRVIVEARWLKGRVMNESYSDLMQETLMRGYRDFADFRGATLPQFLAWLAGIFRHLHADFVAEQNREFRPLTEADELTDKVKTPSSFVRCQERSETVNKALDRLDAESRRVLALRLTRNCSWKVIGRQLGHSADGARMIYRRACEALLPWLAGLDPFA